MLYNYCILFLLFFIYSVIGYIVEVISVSSLQKKLVLSRGFLIGPYLPIFGVGGLFMSVFLQKYRADILVLFVMSMVSCLLIEYIGSVVMEKIFNLRWWDYSYQKFNINGRICLKTGLLFGVGGVIVVKLVNPFLMSIISVIPNIIVIVISIILAIILLIDLTISNYITLNLQINIDKYANKDATEEIKRLVKEELKKHNILNKRLIKSFPHVYKEQAYSKIKSIIINYKKKKKDN